MQTQLFHHSKEKSNWFDQTYQNISRITEDPWSPGRVNLHSRQLYKIQISPLLSLSSCSTAQTLLLESFLSLLYYTEYLSSFSRKAGLLKQFINKAKVVAICGVFKICFVLLPFLATQHPLPFLVGTAFISTWGVTSFQFPVHGPRRADTTTTWLRPSQWVSRSPGHSDWFGNRWWLLGYKGALWGFHWGFWETGLFPQLWSREDIKSTAAAIVLQ